MRLSRLPPIPQPWAKGIKKRFTGLMWKRMNPPAATQKLSSRSTYILPTGHGVFFALVLYAMLMGAMNYSNSMGLLLTFLLAGIALVGMIFTYRNLIALYLVAGHPKAVFAGDIAEFPVYLQTSDDKPVFRIAAGSDQMDLQVVDVVPMTNNQLNIRIPSSDRGWLDLKPIRVQTTFPLGWFRAWSWVAVKSRTLVYPKPAGKHRLPPHVNAGLGYKQTQNSGNDDFAGIRRYQAGDSPAHIAWKALAKGHDVLTKQFSEQAGEEIWLNWDHLQGLNTEQRLSQLCLWVLNLHQQGKSYGLCIPGKIINLGFGEQQRQTCLEALALFK